VAASPYSWRRLRRYTAVLGAVVLLHVLLLSGGESLLQPRDTALKQDAERHKSTLLAAEITTVRAVKTLTSVPSQQHEASTETRAETLLAQGHHEKRESTRLQPSPSKKAAIDRKSTQHRSKVVKPQMGTASKRQIQARNAAVTSTPALSDPADSDLSGERQQDTASLPLAPTQVPSSFEWRFAWTSDEKPDLRGAASWVWQLQAGRFTTRFEAQSEQGLLWRQASQGGLDAAGIAPERFTDERPKAGVRAINFQQTSRTVTFSGPSTSKTMKVGLQDPLSALMQFISILRARTQPPQVGDKVAVQVIGVRAHQVTWVFRLMGEARLNETEAAQHWVREPLAGFEGGLELWLDPKREFVPLRLHMQQTSYKHPFVFTLIEAGVTH
jgi:Protein of unknown function (DUF3108)